MRHIVKIALFTAVIASSVQDSAHAAFVGAPQALRGAIQLIKFDAPSLAPMAFSRFCMTYVNECKPRKQMVFRGSRMKLTAERWEAMNAVNRKVNAAIKFESNTEGVFGEKWIINPSTGDCNDYAVSKRHELMAQGWSARSLLLSEVITTWGEHHLVLVVRTNAGDLVMDSLSGSIVPWSRKAYQWVRIQTPVNPKYWASLADRRA